jgi:2-methylcitrate dehydratase PrpD
VGRAAGAPGDALGELAAWVVSEPWARADAAAHGALRDAVGNLLAVTVAGAVTPEQASLLAAWDPEPGTATVVGTGRRAPAEVAAWLNGVAAVTVERDEGNRHAQGHPAAQTAPAVLALAERLDLSGERLWDALFVAYEVATRFGRAAQLVPRVHTHGVIGLPGAAAGCALLLGLDAAGVRRAMEAACALPVSTGWAPVLAGSAVRDQWVGAANVAGLAAARLAASALPLARPAAAPHLGGTLGESTPTSWSPAWAGRPLSPPATSSGTPAAPGRTAPRTRHGSCAAGSPTRAGAPTTSSPCAPR